MMPAVPQGREGWRLGLLIAAALALTYPFLSPLMIGGTDARWYAYMLADALAQMRAGQFPALMGQGPFAWNGGVHPFRSAPVYVLVGELWNGLTLGHLGPLMIQHLTVVTSAVAAALGFYRAAVAFMPARRWEACLGALIYVAAPVWLCLVAGSDAYMSFMTFAVLPLVLYGNIRTVSERGRAGYPALAAGLVLVWMSHPPIAAWCTFVTLLIQAGSMMAQRDFAWGRAAAGGLWFVGLGAFYFCGMAELPPLSGSGGAGRDLTEVVGLAAALAGLGGRALGRRGRGWAAAGGVGLALLGVTSIAWLAWVAATLAILGMAIGLGRWSGRFDPARRPFESLYACALGGAALTEALLPKGGGWAHNEGAVRQIAITLSRWHYYLGPERWPLADFGADQPGWAVLLGLAAVLLTFFGRRPLIVKLLAAGALSVLLCFVRLPGVSDFLVGSFPPYLAGLCSLALNLRLLPVVAGFAAMAGCLWAGTAVPGGARPWRRWVMLGGLGAAVIWSGWQVSPLVRWTLHQTGDPANSADIFRPENLVLDRFAYDLLPLPSSYSNGEMDPLLENRLRDATGNVVVGPAQDAARMEAQGSVRIHLIARPVPGGEVWLRISPDLTINPGEHLLLRFEFDPRRNYSGFLIMKSEHDYREYHLPESGMGGGRGFGVGGDHGTVLSLWNSGNAPEHFVFTFSREPGNSLLGREVWFADMIVSHLEPALLPVRMESWMPYRATVTTSAPVVLETVRAYLPGYRATLDGGPVEAARSPDHLVQLRVPAGTHSVALEFAGTLRLRCAAAISLVAWLALGLAALRTAWRRRGPPPAGVRWRRWTAAGLIGLFAVEFLYFDHQTSRHYAWIYPQWNDQIQYLTEAYTGYEYALWHGLIPGLWRTLLKPSAQGVLYDTAATLGFWFAGPSRSLALALNLFAWLALQAAFYAVTVRRFGSRALGWVAVALLLCWRTPLSGWAGSAVDFRLDFMAACAFGVALAATIDTDGFRSTFRSALAGAAIGLTLLLRFLTGTYFVLLLLGLLAWVLGGTARRRRAANLLLAAGVAAAMALPEFWRNREWVWNYYVIGHFTGPESAIRNPHLGLGRSLQFVASSLWRDHLGFGGIALAAAITLALAAARLGRRRDAPGENAQAVGEAGRGSWMVPAALFTGVPALVLTLHSQKSPIVVSLLVPGVVALALGVWAALARPWATGGGTSRAARRLGATLAAAGVLWGVGQFVAAQWGDPHGAQFTRDARTVNRLADAIWTASARARLAAPRVAVDRVTDCLDGQVLRVVCYERHREWIPFVMMLPTGIMRERPAVILDHLAQSDFVFLADPDSSGGGFPYDEEMRELRPQTSALCRERFRLVERFPLFGRMWSFYARPGLLPASGQP